jgi:hypothetical protein
MSSGAFARRTPVTPPIVKRKMKASANAIGGLIETTPPHMVASQLKTFIPVGTAIIMVVVVKKARESTSIPTVYIWCAHTIKPRRPIDIIAKTIPR